MTKPINKLVVDLSFREAEGHKEYVSRGSGSSSNVSDNLKVIQTPLGNVLAFHKYSRPNSTNPTETTCPGFGGDELLGERGLRVLAVNEYVPVDKREIVIATLKENGYVPPFQFWS